MASIQPRKLGAALLALVVVMLVSSNASIVAGGGNDKSKNLYPVTYAIYDLPVYRISKNPAEGFAPSILFALIRRSLSAESWRDGATITEYPQNLSMVVVQTEANHAKLANLLESLREKSKE